MSATEIVCRLLDERGVEYETYIEQPTGFEHVKWNFNEHGSADFNLEFGEPWLTMYGIISGPEQAIAATLGDADATPPRQGDAGTCHNISKIVDKYGQARFACSECGAWLDSRMLWNPECSNGESPWVKDCKLNFCPNCGRRIVEPTTNDVDAEVDA